MLQDAAEYFGSRAFANTASQLRSAADELGNLARSTERSLEMWRPTH
jgi:hypothetical protein